jgi:hypothetical protein
VFPGGLAIEGREVENSRRPRWTLYFVLFFSTLIACSIQSPKKQNREDRLRENLRSFHWALIGQDVPNALRFAPPDERDAWDEAFSCIFKRLRLLDYRVELIDFGEENEEATVRVRWTSHPLDSLVVDETLWKEEWSFNRKKQRWSLQPAPGKLKGFPEDCLPEPPESE